MDLKELDEAIKIIEDSYHAECDLVNWYNNNTPGVGQRLDYMSLPPYPKELEKLKSFRKTLVSC